LSSAPAIVDGDSVLLGQVVVNLVTNAMDALAEIPPASRHITIASVVTETNVELSVCDTGIGLPAEIMDTLFKPFVTTKPLGLGIGLVIAQRIVEAHGGAIHARHNVEAGATFTVTLPRNSGLALVSGRLAG